MANDRVKKVTYGYEENVVPITFYNPFNLDFCDRNECFTKEMSRIIPFMKREFHILYDPFAIT